MKNGCSIEEEFHEGDWASFEKIALPYKDALVNFAFYKTGNLQDAQDLVQEAYLLLYKKRKKVKVRDAKTYLFSCVHNLCRNLYKKKKETTMPVEMLEQMETHGMEDLELKQDLMNALRTLKPDVQSILLLRFFGDHSLCEIAAILRLKEGTVKSRMFYGFINLRSKMKGYLTEEWK